MAQSGGCPQEALGTGWDTAADCGLRLTHQIEDLAWPGTQKKKKTLRQTADFALLTRQKIWHGRGRRRRRRLPAWPAFDRAAVMNTFPIVLFLLFDYHFLPSCCNNDDNNNNNNRYNNHHHHHNNDNNNSNNNSNPTERHNLRFLQSPRCATNCLQHVR